VALFRRFLVTGALLPVIVLLAGPVGAQLEDNLSLYSEKNATGYMQPLADAVGADFNTGLFRTARIPKSGILVSFEIPVMLAKFKDDHRTFRATTEEGFFPQQTVDAPTAVGPSDAVIVDGVGDTQFAFPGGLYVNSFALAAPQLRIGYLYGTQAIIRYFAANVGDDELGSVSLFGFGLQHSISQYIERPLPLDLAAGFFWQKYKIGENEAGEDLLSGSAFTIGVQGSRRFGQTALYVEPYGSLSLDTHSMDVTYERETLGTTEDVTLEMDSGTDLHFTIGALLKLYYIGGYVDYGFSGNNTFSFGLIIGN